MPNVFRSWRKLVRASARIRSSFSFFVIGNQRRASETNPKGGRFGRFRHDRRSCEPSSAPYAERSSFSAPTLRDRRRQTMTQKERAKAEDRGNETFVISEVAQGYRVYAPADGKRIYLVRPVG